jgi:hypothetical protein
LILDQPIIHEFVQRGLDILRRAVGMCDGHREQ